MKKILAYISAAFLFITPVFSWPGGSGSGPSGGPGFSNEVSDNTPVDGGIVTVTALAIGYGVRQARKRKEEKNNDNDAI